MKDYITLTEEQKERAIREYIFNWEDSEIEVYRQYDWIIKYADSAWPRYQTYPYIIGVQIPDPEDPNFWEEIELMNKEDYEYILNGYMEEK